MKEPTRLCESDDFPAALRDAFRALEQEAPSAETVMRVQRALQTLPAVSTGAALGTTLGATKLWLVTALIAGVTTFAVVTQSRLRAPRAERDVLSASARAPDHADPSRATPAVLHAPAATRAPDVAERADARDEQPAGEQIHSELSMPVAAKARDLATSLRARPGDVARSKQLHARVAMQRDAVAASRSERASESPALAAAEPETHEAVARDTPQEPPADSPAPSATPQATSSEAALLAQAKRLSTSDPAAALRQVEALARRYPDGIFVQERELLAIQLQQRLGHAAAAEQLIRRFHEHYPNSVYRRALPP